MVSVTVTRWEGGADSDVTNNRIPQEKSNIDLTVMSTTNIMEKVGCYYPTAELDL